jgi:NAD(P)-dependent dehydrogenase (short-subunit alcohol dehydrogenase family)
METIAEIFDLSGKSTIVTGGGKGIGKAIANRLAEAGAAVMIADIDLDAATKAAQGIREKGGKAEATKCDVSIPAEAKKAIEATVQAFGDIHILVNNAGVYPGKMFLELTEEIWDKTVNTNLKSTAFFSQAAAQAMIRAGHGGKIINIGSGSSFRPAGKGLAHYCAAKGGVVSLTRAMAKELTPHGILCNTVVVSTVKSFDTSGSPELAKIIEERGKTLPLGRMGEVDDIAKIVLFMASSASDYINAGEVSADGGIVWIGKGGD